MSDSVVPRVWHHDSIIEEALTTLAEGGAPGAPLIDGRVLSVKATPVNDTSKSMAIGMAVLPPGFSTPIHDHEAEELATILSGEGTITIDGVDHAVRAGSVVLTPSMSRHVTTAGPDAPLVVWWTYAPAGSEDRWLKAGAVDDTLPQHD